MIESRTPPGGRKQSTVSRKSHEKGGSYSNYE